jgi:hypothetical protein
MITAAVVRVSSREISFVEEVRATARSPAFKVQEFRQVRQKGRYNGMQSAFSGIFAHGRALAISS